MRAVFLSSMTVVGLMFWGMAAYSAGAMSTAAPADGYGITAVANSN